MVTGDPQPAKRRRNAASTRTALLAAARARFFNQSYENVGLREIARDVGVDVALVGRYFGNKEELFKEVLRGGKPSKFKAGLSADEVPAFLASLFDHNDGADDRDHIERLLIMLRSASSPQAFDVVRKAVREDVLEPLASALGSEEVDIGATLSLAVLMGTAILRTIVAVEPLFERDRAAFRDRLLRLFEAAVRDPQASEAINSAGR